MASLWDFLGETSANLLPISADTSECARLRATRFRPRRQVAGSDRKRERFGPRQLREASGQETPVR